ncbi:MAG: hypothetical protein HYU37_20060 [Acidobacteria bacterium]|nr:hypothetical protein [Acidobacteriota bacterium]
MFARWRLAALLLVCAALPSFATTYDPVTFDELVARADMIFVGEVVDVRPYPVSTSDGTIIKTRVVFRVQDPIAGTSSALEVLDFFGGEWGGEGMAIAEMPRFAVGDRRVVFAYRSPSISPIVGFRQGLFQVRRDSRGVDRVLTLDGAPLGRPENLGTRASALPPIGTPAMSLTGFVALVERTAGDVRRR